MLRKKVSVIIPVFNEQDYIVPTLQRFLEQDYPKDLLELIVVDNNSTDKTRLLIKEFTKRYPELDIKLVKEKQQGQIYTRKRGIDMGRQSAYLLSLDGESLVPRNFISQSVKALQKKNIDGVAWKLKLPWDIFINFPDEMRKNITLFIRKKDLIQSLIESYFGPNLDGSAFAITSDIYKRIGGMKLSGGPLRYDDDVILSRRIIYSGGRIVSSRGYVIVSGRRMLADIKNYLSGKSHWGKRELKFPRKENGKTPFLLDKDFDILWEQRLEISAEIFLRHMLDALFYHQQHPDNKIVNRIIQKSAKLCGASFKSCLAITKDEEWKDAFNTFKHKFQEIVEKKIRQYVENEISN